MASQYFMDLLTVATFLLVGYTVTMAERNGCNSTIPHGRVNWNTCEDIRNGQKCMYSCDLGYQTHRLSSWLFCDSHTGRWTLYSSYTVFMYNFPKFNEEVLCSPRLCPNSIPNGILSENCEASVDSPPCNYTCKNGYVKTIQTSLTCMPSARWNRDIFSLCTAKDGRQCSWILPDADLDLSCDRRPGSTCTYRCRTLYHSLYSPSTILCQGTDLKWSHKRVCSSVKCPRSFPGGRMSVFCDMSEGSTCAAQCDYGYMARNNSMQVTCLSSGQWNPNPANLCQKRTQCPPVNKDGFIDYGCDMFSGSVCTYKCNQGFTKYVNQILVACRDNGTWNIDLTGICVKDTLCPAFVANGRLFSTCSRRVSETCSINCNSGHTLTLPGMTTTCLSSGRWDADLSNVCVYENSVCPAFVANGWISSTCSRHIGETCSINCNIGYTLTLPGMSTMCLFSGVWDVDLSNVCVFQNSDSSSSVSEASAPSNIIVPLILAVAAVTTIIVSIIIVCFRCQRRYNGNRSPRDETSSSSHISTMYSVGQCRMGSNLNLLSGSQTSVQAHDVSPPPYTEVMKNNQANLGPPPSYEEVNASPARFLPDSYM